MKKIDIYIPVRDRDMERISLCIVHLQHPVINSVTVIDYGSLTPIKYHKVIRVNRETYPIWNKAHALNIGLKDCKSQYFGCVDCDMFGDVNYWDEVASYLNPNNFICSQNVKRTNLYSNFKEAFNHSTNWLIGNNDYKLAIGGVQVFSKEFGMANRGYHEALVYWNGVDYYMYNLAINKGLEIKPCKNPILHLDHKNNKANLLRTEKEKTIANIVMKNRKQVIHELIESGNINNHNWGENRNGK